MTSEGLVVTRQQLAEIIDSYDYLMKREIAAIQVLFEKEGLLVVRRGEVEKNAKTVAELFREYDEWKQIFRDGAMGNQEAYAKARDTRGYFENGKWVRVSDLLGKEEKREAWNERKV